MHLLRNTWTCPFCATRPTVSPSQPQSREVSEPISHANNRPLRILQWNADGTRTKLAELEDRLLTSEIDVALIQESKLKPSARDPRIPGYACVRKDRDNDALGLAYGGGLITFVKDDLCFAKLKASSPSHVFEQVNIKVRASTGDWLILTNCYSPPKSICGSGGWNAKPPIRLTPPA